MKLALAIICSFLLAGTPPLVAQPTAKSACATKVRACCQHGIMPCCQAKPASGSQPAPSAPAPNVNLGQLSLLEPGILIWSLPEQPANSFASISTPLSTAFGAPLFARDCARLL